MEVESRQCDILEQFVLLAKSARGRGLVQLIETATADPNLFAFGELLDAPHIKEARDSSPLRRNHCATTRNTVEFHSVPHCWVLWTRRSMNCFPLTVLILPGWAGLGCAVLCCAGLCCAVLLG